MNKKIQTLSLAVLERAMSAKELEELLKKYELNKMLKGGQVSRFEYLKEPLTDKELNMVKWYLDEASQTSTRDKSVELQISNINYQAIKACSKILFKNKEVLDQLVSDLEIVKASEAAEKQVV